MTFTFPALLNCTLILFERDDLTATVIFFGNGS